MGVESKANPMKAPAVRIATDFIVVYLRSLHNPKPIYARSSGLFNILIHYYLALRRSGSHIPSLHLF